MRLLSLLAVAIAGCYDPAIDDCQFTCPEDKCPGDLTCTAGFCRVAGATGSCSCPTPPVGCNLVTADTVGCLAACGTSRDWAGAQTACAATPPWRLAVLDVPKARMAAENALKTPISWIDLTRTSVLAEWMWPGGTEAIPQASPEWTSDTLHAGATYTCAALDNGKLYSDDCQRSHAYACTPN